MIDKPSLAGFGIVPDITRMPPLHDDIDVQFDFRTDTPPGKDPDSHSRTLRRYHQLLWSKPLPSGVVFDLDAGVPGVYLHHKSPLGEFPLSSDSAIPDFGGQSRLEKILAAIPHQEMEAFVRLTYTIGGMIVFPSNQVDRKMTINGARGCNGRIRDRFDLTLECIRRYYSGEQGPLHETLKRYSTFFALFESFRGYVEFFLLQDLVNPDYGSVRFMLPFDDFAGSPLPSSADSYREYCRRATEFIEARSARISGYVLGTRQSTGVTVRDLTAASGQ